MNRVYLKASFGLMNALLQAILESSKGLIKVIQIRKLCEAPASNHWALIYI